MVGSFLTTGTSISGSDGVVDMGVDSRGSTGCSGSGGCSNSGCKVCTNEFGREISPSFEDPRVISALGRLALGVYKLKPENSWAAG